MPPVPVESKLEDSIATSSGNMPKMRRVRNPYGLASDHSSSQKSASLSQSMQKSKRRIEIEKLSDTEGGYEDSYMDDEFEDTVVSQMSNEKKRLQQKLISQEPEKVVRPKQINTSNQKRRP